MSHLLDSRIRKKRYRPVDRLLADLMPDYLLFLWNVSRFKYVYHRDSITSFDNVSIFLVNIISAGSKMSKKTPQNNWTSLQAIRGSLVQSNVTNDYKDLVPMNATFEISEEDISLVSGIFHLSQSFDAIGTNFRLFVTSMDKFDQEAPLMLSRDSTYRNGFRNH